MRVQTIELYLDRITDPILIPSFQVVGARHIPCGKGMGGAATWGWKVRRWGGPKGGNKNNARWRRRRGGAYVSPVNKRFKTAEKK